MVWAVPGDSTSTGKRMKDANPPYTHSVSDPGNIYFWVVGFAELAAQGKNPHSVRRLAVVPGTR